jgi:nucleotide-binding universal stress UspA family protein
MVADETALTHSILAPLDGSDMGEFAAPYATRVALALGLPVVVARVVEWSAWAAGDSGYLMAPNVYKEVTEATMAAAREEARRISDELRTAGVNVREVVEHGNPRNDLLNLEATEHVALTVMATHGRSGLGRVALGSVADYVSRHGQSPVLLIRARGPLIERPVLERALIPLDGSQMSELAFEPLTLIAGPLIRHVTLLRVIDPDEPAGASREAKRYLSEAKGRVEQRLGERGVTCDVSVRWGAPGDEILRASQEHDMVIMTTHGKTGAMRWAYGSVADEVIHSAVTPLLLTRPRLRGK